MKLLASAEQLCMRAPLIQLCNFLEKIKKKKLTLGAWRELKSSGLLLAPPDGCLPRKLRHLSRM